MLEASELEVALTVASAAAFEASIMDLAAVKADMQASVVKASTLVLAAMAGKREALDSYQAFVALVVEACKQVGLRATRAYIKALAMQVDRRIEEPEA